MEQTAEPMTRAERRLASERAARESATAPLAAAPPAAAPGPLAASDAPVLRESRSDRRGERRGRRRAPERDAGPVPVRDDTAPRPPSERRAARRRAAERADVLAAERSPSRRDRLPVRRVLLGALVLGLLAGGAVAVSAAGVGASDLARVPFVQSALDLVRPVQVPGPADPAARPSRDPGGAAASSGPTATVSDLCVALRAGVLARDTPGYVTLVAAANGSDLDAFCTERIGTADPSAPTEPGPTE